MVRPHPAKRASWGGRARKAPGCPRWSRCWRTRIRAGRRCSFRSGMGKAGGWSRLSRRPPCGSTTVCRLADAAGGVSDDAWAAAAKHYDEDQLAALVAAIALINLYNRLNVIVQQPGGDYEPGQWG